VPKFLKIDKKALSDALTAIFIVPAGSQMIPAGSQRGHQTISKELKPLEKVAFLV